MNQLEDRLRTALAADVELPDMLDDVHRGAARRRTRRTAGVAITLVSVVAVGIGASVGIASRDRADVQPMPPVLHPPSSLVDIDASDTAVFALAPGQLWRHDSEGWEPLFRFPDSQQYVAVAPDGQNMWVWGGAQGLWSSHDGGKVFASVDLQGDPRYGYQVAATGDSVWVSRRDRNLEPLYFRADVASDRFQDVKPARPGSGDGGLFEGTLVALGSRVAVLTYAGEDTSSPLLLISDDARGRDWRELPLPCSGENMVHTAETEAFVLCLRGDNGATVYRTSGGGAEWDPFATTKGFISNVQVLNDDVLLTIGRNVTHRVTASATTVADVNLGEGAWDAATIGETSYVVAMTGKLLVSDDGGQTWADE